MMERCRCGALRLARYDTDGRGRVIDLTPPCACRSRAKRKRAWAVTVDHERRRAAICQRCDLPITGLRNALYCDRHRAEAKAEKNARFPRDRKRVLNRRWAARNRDQNRERDRRYRSTLRSRRLARARARAWRKKNPDAIRRHNCTYLLKQFRARNRA